MLLYIFLLGAALGSFSLVLAWRLNSGKDWIRGRSECDECRHPLSWLDLLPLYSYISLKGRCRYCKKPIPKTVFLAEVFLATVLAVSWYYWPFGLNNLPEISLFIQYSIILVLLASLFWYDLRWFILPNKLVYPLILLSGVFVFSIWLVFRASAYDGLLMPAVSALLLSSFFWLLYAISGGKWIGFGDVRLAVALGLIAGNPINTWLLLFIASSLGVVVSLPIIKLSKSGLMTKIPFGPYLITATIITLLFSDDLYEIYSNIIGV